MHKLLKRQIRKLLPESSVVPNIKRFVDAVNDAYEQSDNDRALLERSINLASQELSERNKDLKLEIEQQQRTQRELETSLATLQATFDSTGEAIFSVDSRADRVMCNRLAKEMLGITSDKDTFSVLFCLRKFKERFKSQDLDFTRMVRDIELSEYHGRFHTLEFGSGEAYEVHSSPRVYQGKAIGRVWCFRDVTAFKESQAMIEHQAYHDALTGLPNRLLLNDRLEHAISLAAREQNQIAVLFIDLDHFKKINDTSGHQIGDQILIQVGERVRGCIREQDTLARIGGDEFVVIVEGLDNNAHVPNLSNRIIDKIKQPFFYKSTDYFIGCSIGISLYPHDASNVEELLRKSDMSMYHAKDKGRSNYQFFDETIERSAMEQLAMENQLRYAIQRNEFELNFQPKVDLNTGEIKSAEALLRWKTRNGMVSPAVFIPVAEQSGLIREISQWVFEEVCRQIQLWKESHLIYPKIAVNLSSLNIEDDSFLDFVSSAMNEYGVSGSYLEFEITETELLTGKGDAFTFIDQIKQMGISLAIDDFGTGYSALSYLHKLPIDSLKIDKSFIMNLLDDEQNQTITKAIISLAKSLGMRVVAEGVESESIKNWLIEKGCDDAQGFYYYRPLSSERFSQLLSETSLNE